VKEIVPSLEIFHPDEEVEQCDLFGLTQFFIQFLELPQFLGKV